MKSLSVTFSLLLLLAIGLSGCGDSTTTGSGPAEESTTTPVTTAETGNATSPAEEGGATTPEVSENALSEERAEEGTGAETNSPSETPPTVATSETGPVPTPPANPETPGEAAPVKLDPKELSTPVAAPTAATGPPSHDAWTALLKKYVTTSGKVNYKGFKGDQAALNAYLETLKAHPPQADWNRNEKLAYWINVYNAFTVDLVVRNYPVKSITDIGGPWNIRFIDIGGKKYTLSEIENKVIRPRFNEPRIHFAVNCASVSCPKLLNGAYTPGKLNQQLTAQTKAYINNPSENTLSPKAGEISQLFEWYQEDFVKKGTLIDFINTYSNTQLKENAKITYKQYNWGLNE